MRDWDKEKEELFKKWRDEEEEKWPLERREAEPDLWASAVETRRYQEEREMEELNLFKSVVETAKFYKNAYDKIKKRRKETEMALNRARDFLKEDEEENHLLNRMHPTNPHFIKMQFMKSQLEHEMKSYKELSKKVQQMYPQSFITFYETLFYKYGYNPYTDEN